MAQFINKKKERNEIERVQKVALKIILGSDYEDYDAALEIAGLSTLDDRRKGLCKQFVKNCIKNLKMYRLFPLNKIAKNTRNPKKYLVTPANTDRLARSAIPHMRRLLNEK